MLNVLLFQVGWFACVLTAAAGRPAIGAVAAVAIMTLHILRAPVPRRELSLVLSGLTIGAVWESLLVRSDLLRYEAGVIVSWAAPFWIILMWGLFATLPNISLRWLRGHRLIAALAGLAGGPLAFYSGYRLGALQFGNEPLALAILAVGWAVLTPLLLALAERFDGYGPLQAGTAS